MKRAANLHDLGRVAVSPRVWLKPGLLSASEWEEVRLHPYHTERIMSRSPFLVLLGRDRLQPPRTARREWLSPRTGFRVSCDDGAEAPSPPCRVSRLLEADRRGRPRVGWTRTWSGRWWRRRPTRPPVERPAGLTEREAQIVGLLARGLQTKQMARALHISLGRPPTATSRTPTGRWACPAGRRHAVRHGAHGLVSWGDLRGPKPRPPVPARPSEP